MVSQYHLEKTNEGKLSSFVSGNAIELSKPQPCRTARA